MRMLKKLTKLEREILYLHDIECRSFRYIGKQLEMGETKISQIYRVAKRMSRWQEYEQVNSMAVSLEMTLEEAALVRRVLCAFSVLEAFSSLETIHKELNSFNKEARDTARKLSQQLTEFEHDVRTCGIVCLPQQGQKRQNY